METALIHRCQTGDHEAFRLLVEHYQKAVYSLAYRMAGNADDARDLTQEAFLRIFRALPGYRFECPFRHWMLRVASSACVDRLRRARPPTLPLLDGVLTDPGPGPEEHVQARDTRAQVRRAVLDLPAHYRVVVVLHYLEGASYRELAQMLDLPLKTVETRLARARALLRGRLAGYLRGEGGEDAVPGRPQFA